MLKKIISAQLRCPKGLLGKLICRKMEKMNGFTYQAIDNFAEISDGMDVLEIGYGHGAGLIYFLEKYKIRLTGIDFSQTAYKKVLKRTKKYITSGRLELSFGNYESCQAGDKLHDRIIFANVVYFWDNTDRVFSKILGELKPGGKLVFYMSNKKLLDSIKMVSDDVFNKYDSNDIKDSLERSGFTGVTINKIVDDSGNFRGLLKPCFGFLMK